MDIRDWGLLPFACPPSAALWGPTGQIVNLYQPIVCTWIDSGRHPIPIRSKELSLYHHPGTCGHADSTGT